MIKLNRTTEYGLIALRHMSRKAGVSSQPGGEVTSAREIADQYGLPFEITAKTLQRLKDTGLIHSAQGAKGGYSLQRPLMEVNLAEFLDLMEGHQSVVACAAPNAEGHSDCAYTPRCEMRGLMTDLNGRVRRFLEGIRLAELTERTGDSPRVELAWVAGEEP